MRAWRRLTGLAIGIEILPGELRAVLVGADGEIIEREQRQQFVMSPEAVTAGIAALVDDIRAPAPGGDRWYATCISGCRSGGPVDPATGVVHHFHKCDSRPAGQPGGRTSRWPRMWSG